MKIKQICLLALLLCFFSACPAPAAEQHAAAIKEESKSASSAAADSGASTKVKLSAKKLELVQFQKKKLKLENSKGKKVRWKSSDIKVARVSTKGAVLAAGEGTCVITARCENRNYTCKVKVKALSLSASSVCLVRGRQKVLRLNNEKAKPAWESSDTRVASVDANGRVQALTPGACTVSASWKGVVLVCSVTVLNISVENLRQAYPAATENQGRVVLAGSSSMDYWDSAPQAFAPFEVINTAIAGTRVVQWLEWYNELIVAYKPSAVVLYVGSNDLANGNYVKGKDNAANTIALLKKLKAALDDIPIFYVGVCPCWAREGAWNEIHVSNQLVQAFCNNTKDLYYIGIGSAFMAADGTPNRANYMADQLHPSARGYVIWKKRVAKPVKKELKARAKAAAAKKTSSK